jgi:Spy/CpxP family protein refolding chaperone
MERITKLSMMAVALFLTAFVIVRAETRAEHGWYGHRWQHSGPVACLARELNLNNAQRAQIRALWQTEWPILSARIHEFLVENKEMNAIAVNGDPDQSDVQKIADREPNTITTLLVEKARLHSKIYSTVLSSEQRAEAQELQHKWKSRVDRFADGLGTQPAEK